MLARLHATLSNGDEDENTVYTTITRTVAQAVHSPAVALALHRGPHIETVSITGAEQDTPLMLPLIYRGERLGEMRVSPRTPGEPYGRIDRALLDQLANQTSGLIYALRRDAELQSTRRQALETVAEERTPAHAHAQHCEVTVTLTPGELDLNVKDDGVGLKQPYVSGIGISSMRSRVQALGGTFNLTAAPDRGTLLRARIPVTP